MLWKLSRLYTKSSSGTTKSNWCANSGICPQCHGCLDAETDIGTVKMLPLQLWSVLKIKCIFESNGCKETFGLNDTEKKNLKNHEETCTFKTSKQQAKTKKPRVNKKPIFDVNRHYLKHERLQPIFKEVEDLYSAP